MTLKPYEASRVHHPPSGSASLHACCYPKAMVLVQLYMILDEKGVYLFPLCHFDSAHSNWSDPHVWFAAAASLLTEKFCFNGMPTSGIFLTHSRKANNSSILLPLITLMVQLMVGVPRVTGTLGSKGRLNLV